MDKPNIKLSGLHEKELLNKEMFHLRLGVKILDKILKGLVRPYHIA